MSVIVSGSTSVSGSTDVGYRLNTDGLQFFLDMINPGSYPGSGERIYDLSPKAKDTSLDLTTYTGGSTPYFTTGNTSIDETVGFNSSDLSTNTLTGSFEMVIKFPPNTGAYLNLIFGYRLYYFGIVQQVNTLVYGTGNGDFWGCEIDPSFYDQWHYITCVMHNLRVGNTTTRTDRVLSNQIWVDGVQQPVTSRGVTNIPGFQGFDLAQGRIGTLYYYYDGNDPSYNGIFDCALFRAYDRALTPEEINKNYRHLKPIYNLA